MVSSWLGFKDVALVGAAEDEPVSCTDSFLGGIPVLASHAKLEAGAKCDSGYFSCLVQLYCPLDSHPDMHRSLLVLMPSEPKATLTSKSFKVFRIQWSAMTSSMAAGKNEGKVKMAENAAKADAPPMFAECDNWGDNGNGHDDCWALQPPSNKKSACPKNDLTNSLADAEQTASQETKNDDSSEKSKNMKFKQRFEPYFLTFDAEDLSELSSKKDDHRVSKLMEEYKKTRGNDDSLQATEDDNDSLDSNELLDMARKGTGAARDSNSSSLEDDQVFRKFHHRISSDPSQILRFGGAGEYLPVYNSRITYPRNCSACGSPLGCELQILPSFVSCISEIESQSSQSSFSPEIPLFSLGVFTCANTSNCSKFDEACLRIEDVVFEVEK